MSMFIGALQNFCDDDDNKTRSVRMQLMNWRTDW